ncbi:MAG: energy transducer TonB [Flavobacteriales bacterium]
MGLLSHEGRSALETYANETNDWALQLALEGHRHYPAPEAIDALRDRINQKAGSGFSWTVALKAAAVLFLLINAGIGFYFLSNRVKEDQNLVIHQEEKETLNDEASNHGIDRPRIQTFEEELTNTNQHLSSNQSKMSARSQDDFTISPVEEEAPITKELLSTKDANKVTESAANFNQMDLDAVVNTSTATPTPTALNKKSEEVMGVAGSEVKSKATSTLKQGRSRADILSNVASYPGGTEALKSFIRKERKNCFNTTNRFLITDEPKVKIQVNVDIDGNLSNLKVLKSLTDECDTEALRIVRLMPMWIPAQRDGRPVADKVQIDVNFD